MSLLFADVFGQNQPPRFTNDMNGFTVAENTEVGQYNQKNITIQRVLPKYYLPTVHFKIYHLYVSKFLDNS